MPTTIEKRLERLLDAYEFYLQSPDGQYDLFICDILMSPIAQTSGRLLSEISARKENKEQISDETSTLINRCAKVILEE